MDQHMDQNDADQNEKNKLVELNTEETQQVVGGTSLPAGQTRPIRKEDHTGIDRALR